MADTVRPVVLRRDPEALLAWWNCRYGFFRDYIDLRDPTIYHEFNRVILASPRDPDYHWIRSRGLAVVPR